MSWNSLRLLADLGLSYVFVTVSEEVVHRSVHVRKEVAHVWVVVVVVRYSVYGEVVRYLLHQVVLFFVHGGEEAVSVHVQEAVEAVGRDSSPISLMMSCHWWYVYPLWEEAAV